MVTDEELVDMRADFNTTLTETCEIRHIVTENDGAGDQKSSWPTVAYTSPGKITSVSREPQERVVAEKLTNIQPYVIVLPAGSVVYESSQIHISGRVFEVVAPINHTFELGRRIVCKEIK